MNDKTRTKAIAVVGAQWGDEGKGKVVDYLASSFDYTARYAGGHNAGHTVIFNSHKYVLQLIPSGILRPGKKAVIGTGTVVDPAALVGELENLKKSSIDVRGRLFLSNRAHVIFPYHREMDRAAEGARGAAAIGTTSRGIGPAYEDKMARRGIRVCDLLDPDRFREKLERVVAEKNAISSAAYGHKLETAGLFDQYLEIAAHIRGLVADTAVLLNNALDNGETVLFEGAQGTMLDIDHGTYPFVTSSNATSGGAFTGLGRGSDAAYGRGRRDKGVHHARGQRSVSHGNARRRRGGSSPARQRVWRGHGTPSPLRLARSAGAAICEDAERDRFARRDEAGRVRRAGGNSSLHGISLQGRNPQRNAAATWKRLRRSSLNIKRCPAGESRRPGSPRRERFAGRRSRLSEFHFRRAGNGDRNDLDRSRARRHHRPARHATRVVVLTCHAFR